MWVLLKTNDESTTRLAGCSYSVPVLRSVYSTPVTRLAALSYSSFEANTRVRSSNLDSWRNAGMIVVTADALAFTSQAVRSQNPHASHAPIVTPYGFL